MTTDNYAFRTALQILKNKLPSSDFWIEPFKRSDPDDLATGRFWFRYKKDQKISVYYCNHEGMGFEGHHYFEIYPNQNGDRQRFSYDDKTGLLDALIEAILHKKTYVPPAPTPQKEPLHEIVQELREAARKTARGHD